MATAVLLLGPVGCVAIEARPILLELTTSKWFVLFGTEPSSGDTVVSGIFPREAAILSSIPLTDVGVLGWKEQPPGLSGALDRPGKIARGCEPALPRPDEAIQIDGRALKNIPAIGGPWLDEGSCPPLPPGSRWTTAARSRPARSRSSICRAEQKECRLSVLDAVEPMHFERRPLISHGARVLPPTARAPNR